jgi:tetratricopeptide (TPR) repeat protein
MLGNLGLIAYFEGNHERARRLHEEALDVARELGDRNSEAITLSNLGLVAFAVGDHPRAAALQRETIEIRRSVSNRGHMARSLENVALIAASTGRPASAVRLFAAADAIRTEIGSPIQPNDREIHDRHLERARSELDDAAFAAAWSDGSSLAPDAAVQLALDVSAEVEAGSAAVAS